MRPPGDERCTILRGRGQSEMRRRLERPGEANATPRPARFARSSAYRHPAAHRTSTSTYATRSGERSINRFAPLSPLSSRNLREHTTIEQHRMSANAAIARRDDRRLRLAPARDHRTHDRRIDLRLIAERDERRGRIRRNRRDSTAQRRRESARPIRILDDARVDRRARARTASASFPTTTMMTSVAAASARAASRTSGTPSSGATSFCEPNRVAPPAASSTPTITMPPAEDSRPRAAASRAEAVTHRARAGGGSPSSDACIHDASSARASLTRMPRTCSVSSDADAMHSAHASAVNRASAIVPPSTRS